MDLIKSTRFRSCLKVHLHSLRGTESKLELRIKYQNKSLCMYRFLTKSNFCKVMYITYDNPPKTFTLWPL